MISKTIKVLKILGSFVVGVSAILAAYYSYQSLDLQKAQVIKESLPFFKYRYSEDSKGFVVETDEDVSIHSIQWFFPASEKTFDGFLKYSNLLTIDEIIFRIWSTLSDREIFILTPDSSTNVYGYIQCSVLAVFDEYNSAIEKDTGFPLGVFIEYTRKGQNRARFLDVVLIKEFDESTPQIQIVKTNATEDEMKEFMKKGAERLTGILPIYPYDQNRNYMENNKCTQTSSFWKKYFFNKADEEEFRSRFPK